MQQFTHFIAICIFLLPSFLYANSKGPSIKEALEITVEQQILSQKIAKIYLTLCYDIRNPKLYKDRAATVAKYEEQLYQLSLFIPNERVKEHIQAVRVVWKEFKSIADWSIKKSSITALLNKAKELLKASKMLHSAYQEYEYTIQDDNNWITINQYINQVQHQKILMQQILTYYMANGHTDETLDCATELATFQKSFVRILYILEKATTTSASIQETLQLIRTQWLSIIKQFSVKENDVEALHRILEQGTAIEENIQKVMDSYGVLSANLSLSHMIHQGAKQCVLVQQMSTTYVTSNHKDIKYVYQQQILDQTNDFEHNLEGMLLAAPTLEIQDAVEVVQTMWKNYKNLLVNFETMNEVQTFKTLEQGLVVMAACDQANVMIKRHAETVPAYQKILPQNNGNSPMSEDMIFQIEQLSHLKIESQRSALYFMMKALNWDIALSIKRLEASRVRFKKLLAILEQSVEEPSRQKVLAEIKKLWETLNDVYEEGTKDNFLKVVQQQQELNQKLNKLSDACIYELNQLFAQDLQINY
ncbi:MULTISPECIES: hypothetical protein [unclassified Aureispira]|uniref:hypothetical protein n=1 Tax=unclassified Aureispira TaxID=2649989 RepID=UPI000697E491|nr:MULTISPECIES: hypothetical protein [unclassified Aureispira]WMX12927.1 hypothetical protein QP953_18990 [Aureispira sp. CCB-E]